MTVKKRIRIRTVYEVDSDPFFFVLPGTGPNLFLRDGSGFFNFWNLDLYLDQQVNPNPDPQLLLITAQTCRRPRGTRKCSYMQECMLDLFSGKKTFLRIPALILYYNYRAHTLILL